MATRSEDTRDADRRDGEVSPGELARRTPEDDGQGAGPGAPETLEPTQGRDGDEPSGPPQRDLGAHR